MVPDQLLDEQLSHLFYRGSLNAIFSKKHKKIISLLFGLHQALQQAFLKTPSEHTILQNQFWIKDISLFEQGHLPEYPLLKELIILLNFDERKKIAQALYECVDGLSLETAGIVVDHAAFLETVAYKKCGFMLEALAAIQNITPLEPIKYWAQYFYGVQLLHDVGLYKRAVGFKSNTESQHHETSLCAFIDNAYRHIDRKKETVLFMKVLFSYHQQMYSLLRSELDFLSQGTFYFGGLGHLRVALSALIM